MSKAHSPSHFNGEADSFYDPNFTLDINQKMRVPKSIRLNGEYNNETMNDMNGTNWNHIATTEKFEMHVPDRILVIGQEQHIGTKAPPREMTLENAVIPPEPGMVRVQTPPRVLTLDNHYFPTADEEEHHSYDNDNKEVVAVKPHVQYSTEQQVVKTVREQTPVYNPLDVSLPPSEEIQHLRQQVGRLNRRVMAIELDMQQRQSRDTYLYGAALAYFIMKVFSWLTRN